LKLEKSVGNILLVRALKAEPLALSYKVIN